VKLYCDPRLCNKKVHTLLYFCNKTLKYANSPWFQNILRKTLKCFKKLIGIIYLPLFVLMILKNLCTWVVVCNQWFNNMVHLIYLYTVYVFGICLSRIQYLLLDTYRCRKGVDRWVVLDIYSLLRTIFEFTSLLHIAIILLLHTGRETIMEI